MGSDYVSQIVLLPQHADWRWYRTLRPYLEKYRITVTKSADDAGSFHGRDHTVTILESPQAWPGGIVQFFKTRYPQAKLDYVPFQSLQELSNLIATRATLGEAGRVLSANTQGPFGPAPASTEYDSHIVLLPNGCDWQWYEAVQRYVLRYRVTVAQSADDAGSFHGRNHVVTAIIFPGAYNADLRAWFQANYPNAQFDPIEITTPDELRARLDKRVARGEAGRFGQGEPYAGDPQPWELEPFHLRWPVSDVRQPARFNFSRLFAASPWDYRSTGLIAHEGLDFQRTAGTPVLAAADGEVIERELNNPFYGQYVRLKHAYGTESYETVYAHLSAISVGPVGTIVKAGDPIGLVGSTGRAFGAHLHFNLERSAPATSTPGYRRAYLDPSLYLTWPDGYTLERREELPHIFGVHEDVARDHPLNAGRLMQQAGIRGYVLWTEALTDLDDTSGLNYTLRATGDHTVIVRLNYGYDATGTLPPPAQYDRFARRCGNFARNSQGVSIYVIANEMNNPREWPQGQPISPENYAACFNLVYRRIKEADPRAMVCPGAIDPYNGQWGDMRDYWRRMLNNITACDGLAVHAYTHGPDPSLVEDQSTFTNPPLLGVHFNFWVFQDVLMASPARFRSLPVYLTETDHIFIDQAANLGWKNVNSGWIWAMYQQVDDWNKRGGQQIHAALVYRYPQLDQWSVVDKPNVVQDFQQALTLRYKPYHWRL
jgi:murein DD-endopeptidase MepM/ murein hydrolase activator NlpD